VVHSRGKDATRFILSLAMPTYFTYFSLSKIQRRI
jgi:hypothetical protein